MLQCIKNLTKGDGHIKISVPRIKKRIKKDFPLSLHGWVVSILALGAASALFFFLQRFVQSDVYVPMIFVLAVLIISLMTEGYFYGTLAAMVSVLGVNWAFTYPYAKFNFTIYGYPLTFITMLAVGIAVSTLATRLKETERLRVESEKERVRANLLRAISHDLRTPLTSISGAISAVLEEGAGMTAAQREELLRDAKKDSEWLCRMVENLLSITRISGGEMNAIHKEEEVLEEVLGEAVLNFKNKNPGVKVSVSVPDELLFVPMDAMLVEQVLINLMDNAVMHGVTTTQIRLDAVGDGSLVYISVTDNGRGISDEAMEHLFDGMLSVNKKAGADTTRSMGIGLLVCRTIVEAHGGTIKAQNIPGGGARFIFTLSMEGNHEHQG